VEIWPNLSKPYLIILWLVRICLETIFYYFVKYIRQQVIRCQTSEIRLFLSNSSSRTRQNSQHSGPTDT
jgi:hypothetical protein